MRLLRVWQRASGFARRAGSMVGASLRWSQARVEYFAVLGSVGVGTWAAWDWTPIAGKAVLALGLLFIGGGISRLSREVRGG